MKFQLSVVRSLPQENAKGDETKAIVNGQRDFSFVPCAFYRGHSFPVDGATGPRYIRRSSFWGNSDANATRTPAKRHFPQEHFNTGSDSATTAFGILYAVRKEGSCELRFVPSPPRRNSSERLQQFGGEGQGEGDFSRFQSQEKPRIRPSATFSPYEGEKGQRRMVEPVVLPRFTPSEE